MTLTWRPWAALLLASSALAARADIVTLSFESAGNLNRLADYYNGGYNGTDNRIAFDSLTFGSATPTAPTPAEPAQAVTEPSTLALLGLALLGLALFVPAARRLRRR